MDILKWKVMKKYMKMQGSKSNIRRKLANNRKESRK